MSLLSRISRHAGGFASVAVAKLALVAESVADLADSINLRQPDSPEDPFVRETRITMRGFPRFAMVSAVLVSAARRQSTELSLSGKWRFKLDRADPGMDAGWFRRHLADSIQLSGVRQAQGFGDQISTNKPWVPGLGGDWRKRQPKELCRSISSGRSATLPTAQADKLFNMVAKQADVA